MTKLALITKILMVAGTGLLSVQCSGKGTSTAGQSDTAATTTAVNVPDFNADSAYAYVAMQTEGGPRVPGTPGHARVADKLAGALKAAGADTVIEQRATVTQVDGSSMPVRNIMGRFGADKKDRILLLAHYDTRPWADEDSDSANHSKPIDGANDGASGVGVLLEIGRQRGQSAPNAGVDILFTDSEDSGIDAPEGSSADVIRQYDLSWCLGTQYFVRNLPYTSANIPRGAILLDMVGGKDAVMRREYFSVQAAPQLVSRIWKKGQELGYGTTFNDEMGGAVNDDHIHLIGVGIPTVDIIEIGHPQTGSFNPTWHTMADNIGNIDKNTLKAVGQTVLAVVYEW